MLAWPKATSLIHKLRGRDLLESSAVELGQFLLPFGRFFLLSSEFVKLDESPNGFSEAAFLGGPDLTCPLLQTFVTGKQQRRCIGISPLRQQNAGQKAPSLERPP